MLMVKAAGICRFLYRLMAIPTVLLSAIVLAATVFFFFPCPNESYP